MDQEYLFLKMGYRIQKVAIRKILFVKGMRDYVRIHTTEEKIMTLLNFAKPEELLPSLDFVRVHRSFPIAIYKINHIEKNRIQIIDQTIPISDTYAEAFYKILKDFSRLSISFFRDIPLFNSERRVPFQHKLSPNIRSEMFIPIIRVEWI